jgi:hypothetical protein
MKMFKRIYCFFFGHNYRTKDGLRCKRCNAGWPA